MHTVLSFFIESLWGRRGAKGKGVSQQISQYSSWSLNFNDHLLYFDSLKKLGEIAEVYQLYKLILDRLYFYPNVLLNQ